MKKPKTFNRRYYHHLTDIFSDSRTILARRKQIKSLMRDGSISNTFRERIMLAVTEVNGCRYCQFAHAKMALEAGLSEEEIKSLSAGSFQNCPDEEVPALLYAQHWAEENGKPDPEVRRKVVDIYSEETVESIELAMSMIRMGNLLGNTWDYILFRLSFGALGN
jgi:AhpD family alkylhydroperoxidase